MTIKIIEKVALNGWYQFFFVTLQIEKIIIYGTKH